MNPIAPDSNDARLVDARVPSHLPVRLGMLSSHLIQYFSPLYRQLKTRVDAFEVAYFRQVDRDRPEEIYDPGFGLAMAWDTDLRSGYSFSSFGLPNAPFSYSRADVLRIAAAVRAWQKEFRPDVVIVPGWTLPYAVAVGVLRAAGTKIVLRPEGRVRRPAGLVRGLARDTWCHAIIRAASSAAVIGSASRDELLRLGMKPSQFAFSPYVIDTDSWCSRMSEARHNREATRIRLGFEPADVVYLYVGKLSEYKRPRELLEAFITLCGRIPRARLLLVGDGVLRAELAQRVVDSGLSSKVTFTGFVNQSELPQYYASADVFVLPSIETWGLVANEALLARLPLAVSIDAGCARDLVVDGVTGRRLFVESHSQFVEALEQLSACEVRTAMQPNLERLAGLYTLDAAANGIINAVRIAMDEKKC